MNKSKEDIVRFFGDKLRVRVNGILIEDDKILLIKHRSLGLSGVFWATPGGGMEYGSSAEDNLKREFLEETGLEVKVGDFLFVHEYLDVPLHAIELFFTVFRIAGSVSMGLDPEIPIDNQIISDIRFISFQDIKKMPKTDRHQIFEHCTDLSELLSLRGYFK